jgi:hypothetical protein
METHEGTGIFPKAAYSRHPAIAPPQFERARLPESSLKIVSEAFFLLRELVTHLPPAYTHGAPSTVYDSSADGGTSISPLAM